MASSSSHAHDAHKARGKSGEDRHRSNSLGSATSHNSRGTSGQINIQKPHNRRRNNLHISYGSYALSPTGRRRKEVNIFVGEGCGDGVGELVGGGRAGDAADMKECRGESSG